MDNDYMLTTVDNPINPFTDFALWWKRDLLLGHDCCGTLAREAATSEIFSDEVNNKRIDDAMNRLCKEEPLLYRKVTANDYKS